MEKFERAVRTKLPAPRADDLMALAMRPEELEATAITRLMAMLRA